MSKKRGNNKLFIENEIDVFIEYINFGELMKYMRYVLLNISKIHLLFQTINKQ